MDYQYVEHCYSPYCDCIRCMLIADGHSLDDTTNFFRGNMPIPEPIDNVIRVDFKTKCRIQAAKSSTCAS